MKLLSYNFGEKVSFGVLTNSGVVDIPSSWGGPNAPISLKDAFCRDDWFGRILEIVEKSEFYIPEESIVKLTPIVKPEKIFGLAGNYSEHIIEAGLKLGLTDSPRQTTVPRPFLMPGNVVANPGDVIEWPVYSDQVDYELELGVVIGKKAKCVSGGDAADHIAGYMIVNDISARSVSFREGRESRPWDEFFDWLGGKWSDGFLPMGPYLLTADEVEDVQNLNMELKVNGEVRQKANTGQMIFPVSEIVSFISHIVTLEPGDVIATGTPAGVGMADGRFLKGGDLIECEIENLGKLVNKMGTEKEKYYRPLTKK